MKEREAILKHGKLEVPDSDKLTPSQEGVNRAPLDPFSTLYYNQMRALGTNGNMSMAVHLNRAISEDLLNEALRMVMARHPILRSRISIRKPGELSRYYWVDLGESHELPLRFERLNRAKADVLQEIRRHQRDEHDEVIPVWKSYPFRIVCHQWRSRQTTLQLVFSHAAGDGRSLVIFTRDLLRIYLALEVNGHADVVPLHHNLANWEQVFGCRIDPMIRMWAPVIAGRQYYRLLLRDRFSLRREQEWRWFGRGAGGLHRLKNPQNLLATFPKFRDGICVERGAGHITELRHTILGPELERFRGLAVEHNCFVADIVSMAYIKAQQQMAQLEGATGSGLRVVMPLDLRIVQPTLSESIGNNVVLSGFLYFFAERSESFFDSLARFVHLKLESVSQWRESVTRLIQQNLITGAIPDEHLDFFLELCTRRSSPRCEIILSHLGNLDSFFDRRMISALKISDMGLTGVAGRLAFVCVTQQFKHSFTVSFTFREDVVDTTEVRRLWRMFLEQLGNLSSGSGVLQQSGED